MTISFYKMHANGNDFMLIDNRDCNTILPSSTIVSRWADRHTGIGFDQLLFVARANNRLQADIACRIFNASGEEAEQCGHGMACVTHWLYEYGGLLKDHYRIELLSGICEVNRLQKGWVVVNLGIPQLASDSITPPNPTDLFLPLNTSNISLKTSWLHVKNAQRAFFVSTHLFSRNAFIMISDAILGCLLFLKNPHYVVLTMSLEGITVDVLKAISEHNQLPCHVNVTCIQILTRSCVRVRVYERGVGETRACGTGACAAVIIGRLLGYLEPMVTVTFPKGDTALVGFNALGSNVQFHTTTQFIFKGYLP